MKRSTLVITVGLLAVASLSWTALRDKTDSTLAAATPPVAMTPNLVAGPGLVEAGSEEIRVSAQVSGRLEQVLVDEGDRVTAGQIIAVIDNRDWRARVASAQAELALAEAALRRVTTGSRAQEKREAEAVLAEAQAVLERARTEQTRSRQLLADGVISRTEADDADRAERVAAARVDAARERLDLVNVGAREEDRASAAASADLARARLAEAKAQLDKTFVRAPIDGVILRRRAKAGESVSIQFDSPVVTMADDRVRRVRMDVDETDVARVAVGQSAFVKADGFGDRRFTGRVVRVGQILGRKNIRTDEPTERVDTKVLETLIQLDGGRELPLGLRVQAYIERK